MKRMIKVTAAMKPDVLDYKAKDDLAAELFAVVVKYFDNYGHGTPRPRVSYSEYDILEYTFKINSQTYNMSVDYLARVEGYTAKDINQFKADIRKTLKGHGFTRVKFDLRSVKIPYEWWGEKKYDICKELIAIYFA